MHRQRSRCEDFKEDPRREQEKEHRATSLTGRLSSSPYLSREVKMGEAAKGR